LQHKAPGHRAPAIALHGVGAAVAVAIAVQLGRLSGDWGALGGAILALAGTVLAGSALVAFRVREDVSPALRAVIVWVPVVAFLLLAAGFLVVLAQALGGS
jgi:hypothetical protein